MKIERKVSRGGIHFERKRYCHPALARYTDVVVTLERHGEDLLVYDGDGTPICTAKESVFKETPEKEKLQ